MPTPPETPRSLAPRDIIRSGLCIGCGVCASNAAEPRPGLRMELDVVGHFKPAGDARELRRRSVEFARTCPFSPSARDENQIAAERFPDAPHSDDKIGTFESAYVGYVAAEDFRERGSSGGMVSWVMAELLDKGLIDGAAHVVPVDDPQAEDGRFFHYRVSRTRDEIRQGAKSRYYPVELSDVLDAVRATPGRYAVVGVPCFIKALNLVRQEDAVIRERIVFTLGLFCGHMKSARFVESFAWQMDVPLQDVQRVEFRRKDPDRAASVYTAVLTRRDGSEAVRDWWNLVDGDWGAGFFQNSACNFCDDVVAETADISFGDAWVEPYSSDGRGTNVIVTRSPEVARLVANAIDDGRLRLEPVDAAFVEQTQAAGFRQRREGLAYRLTWSRPGKIRPRKRVAPDARTPTARRKLIYRMRALITSGSHRVFWLARRALRPELYTRWARVSLSAYHGLAYGRGKLGEWLERHRLFRSD